MIIYKSKFLEVNYLEVQHIKHFLFSPYASYMDREGLFHEMLNFLSHRIHKRSRLFYMDMRQVEHLTDEEFMSWFHTYILPKTASYQATKCAWLFNGTDLNWDKKIALPNGQHIHHKTFTDPSGLMNWLQSGD